MTCTTCGQANPDGARFCNECATPLAAACAACGGENPPGAKFCNGCGAEPQGSGSRVQGSIPPEPHTLVPQPQRAKHLAGKVLASRAAMEGERKQVTVLFADVKGSMELAEQLDPEQGHAILDHFFQILTVDGYMRLRSLGEFAIEGAKEPLPSRALHQLPTETTRHLL